MTDQEDIPEDEEEDLLAAEYVLGVLPFGQRAAAEARLKSNPGFAAAVARWETRMSGLNDAYDEAPAPDLFPKIEARIFGQVRRKTFWRSWFAGAGTAAALGAAVLFMLPSVLPPPQMPLATLAADASALRYDVVLTRGQLQLRRISGAAAPGGQVHELWLIAGTAAPVSLGLITADEATLPAPAGLTAGVVLAISLEPAGGSPTGAPTGPVLVTGVVG